MNRKISELFKVRDNVTYTTGGDTTIKEAVDEMNAHHIGALPVVDKSGNLAGIVTERDVMMKLASTDDLVGHILVKDIMTNKENLIVISGDETIAEIMRIMVTHNIHHLPIVDDNFKLHGIVVIRDILELLLKDAKQEAKDLKDYVTGKYPS